MKNIANTIIAFLMSMCLSLWLIVNTENKGEYEAGRQVILNFLSSFADECANSQNGEKS
jgi:hypothetical protein